MPVYSGQAVLRLKFLKGNICLSRSVILASLILLERELGLDFKLGRMFIEYGIQSKPFAMSMKGFI